MCNIVGYIGKSVDEAMSEVYSNACADVWDKGTIAQGAPLVYEIMRALKKEGKLRISLVSDEGAAEGYTANNFRIYI